jgi:hypothetical protein
VEAIASWEDLVQAVVICWVCQLAIALYLLVIPSCKCAINPITNPEGSVVTLLRDNIVYFATLSIAQTIYDRMIGRLVNNKLERTDVARFEVLTVVVMKSKIFRDITPCSQLSADTRRTTRRYIPEDGTLLADVASTSGIFLFSYFVKSAWKWNGVLFCGKTECFTNLPRRWFQVSW